MLAVIDTHPVQYRAPVYRMLRQRFGVPVTAVYGSDFSIAGYRDAEFHAEFAWDTDLLSGYDSRFLSRARAGDTVDLEQLASSGIAAALEAVAPEAVLLVGYGLPFHRRAWMETWRRGLPLLFRGETTDQASPRHPAARWMRSTGLRVAYRRVDACLYIGQHSRAHFERLGVPADRLFFSPYCVDESTFDATEASREMLRADTRRALNLNADDRLLLFVGKLSRRKGVDLLVPAVRACRESGRRNIVLGLVGDGELRPRLEEAVRDGSVPARFIGFQNQRRLSRYYHAADLLVLPSRHSETWGLVVNEALLHGLPCVVSDRVGAGADLIDSNIGAVCRPDDVESLAKAMALVEPFVGDAGTRAACRAKVQPYGVEAAARGIADAYRAVTSAARRRAS